MFELEFFIFKDAQVFPVYYIYVDATHLLSARKQL